MILTIEEAKKIIIERRKELLWNGYNRKFGFCQGTFDLIHQGHIMHLKAAKQKCTKLIVAINDDELVSARKGSGRPIIPAKESAKILDALMYVDMVIITPYKTASPLIKLLKPDYYIKGIDYKNQHTPGITEERRAIRAVGGKMIYTDTPKYSTSELIKHIQEKCVKKKLLMVLDRDGTIIKHVPWLGKNNNWKKQIRLNKKLIDFLYYADKKYDLTNIVVTNQGGVARGLFTEATVKSINNYVNKLLKKEGIIICNWQYCPDADIKFALNHPKIKFNRKYVKLFTNRKPDPGMLYKSLGEMNYPNWNKMIVIGDSKDDSELAEVLKKEFKEVKYVDVKKGGIKQWMKTLED
jgi:rfaE bifunctional protein nucleotidyltransferase chain/domain